ncbi:hypothetical protein VIN01S_36520 [Vibrio inusitatus NBRC 102082]|uniref:Lipoprotein n=1 Tax=Vibrio inusitatus NBRC 102082 TaxID=1219070 RepID=A0A4Y3I0W1_9VIBR|nr:hypothetical protein [Vibrio inusitatus]GEA52848.1 hypothetical protein VIN01S_36520 [Vibrio inusitatus NBRC 102082]
MKIKLLSVLTSSLLLSACGGSDGGGEEPNNDVNTLSFQVINLVDQGLGINDPIYKSLEVEIEYSHPVDGELDTEIELPNYLFGDSSFLSIRDSEESPLYVLEYYLEYEEDDDETELAKVTQSLQVESRTGKQLIFAIGDSKSVPPVYELAVDKPPTSTASTNEYSVYVFNAADIAEIQPYDIKVTYSGAEQVGLGKTGVVVKAISAELVLDQSQSDIEINLSRSGSDIVTCDASYGGLNTASNQWVALVTPILGAVTCDLLPLN